MSHLEIRLFGQLAISQTTPVSLLPVSQLPLTNACQKLLAFLLLNSGKSCRRETLMSVFWKESSPNRARSCLNSALWRLRRELEPFGEKAAHLLMTTESGEIGFNWEGDYWLDVQVFEHKVAPALRKPVAEIEASEASHIEQMLTLYRGELLEGIYDDWTLVERERFRLMYLNTLTHLMNYHSQRSAFEKSIEFAKEILKEDPLREDIHRSLMRLHLSAGQRSLALQQYRTCAAVLKRELDVAPMEETQLLYRQLHDTSTPPLSMPLALLSDPVQREQHLAAVVRNLEQAHTHLKQAAHVMTHLIHVPVEE